MSDDDSKYPSELAERFQVRLPLGMRDRIRVAAEANNRSMNAEIVSTLEEKYPAPPDPSDALLSSQIVGEVFRLMAQIAEAKTEDERARLLAAHGRLSEDLKKIAERNEDVYRLLHG